MTVVWKMVHVFYNLQLLILGYNVYYLSLHRPTAGLRCVTKVVASDSLACYTCRSVSLNYYFG